MSRRRYLLAALYLAVLALAVVTARLLHEADARPEPPRNVRMVAR